MPKRIGDVIILENGDFVSFYLIKHTELKDARVSYIHSRGTLPKSIHKIIVKHDSIKEFEPKPIYKEYIHEGSDYVCGTTQDFITVPVNIVQMLWGRDESYSIKEVAEIVVNEAADILKGIGLTSPLTELVKRLTWRFVLNIKKCEFCHSYDITLLKANDEAIDTGIIVLKEPAEERDGPDWWRYGYVEFAPIHPELPLLVVSKRITGHCGPDGYATHKVRVRFLYGGEVLAEKELPTAYSR